jgi:hypothetical protein
MTDPNDDAKASKRPYRVPPEKSRFVKGTSGNPKGRPPRERVLVPTKFGGQSAIGFESRLKAIAIEEAYRLITVREGERTERVPVIQAILRKVAVNGANGNTRAQQIYLDLLIGAEADRAAAAAELLKAVVEYKENWAVRFAEYDRRDVDRPEPVPHPDDIVIDYKTGKILFKGPVMTEQKDAREAALFNKKEFERNLERCTKVLEANPHDLEMRKAHKKLKTVVEWLKRGAPFSG